MAIDENLVVDMVHRGIISDTFRRLPPDKKERIYNTALDLFGIYGYDGLAIDQLCRKSGISKGSFFQYFPSKTNLLEFTLLIFDDRLDHQVAEIQESERVSLTRDRLHYLFNAVSSESFLSHTESRFFQFASTSLAHSGVELAGLDLHRHLAKHLNEIITRGIQTGEIRGDYPPKNTGRLLMGILMSQINLPSEVGSENQDDHIEYLISALFDGIKA